VNWTIGALILVAFAALAFAAARTWRTKARKEAGVVPPVRVPTGLSAALGSWDGFYVATTRADDQLNRIASGGLGFRGRGGVTVHREGVVLTVAGVDDRWIDRSALRGVDRATWTIDRVVESGGLIRLRWTATGAAGATDLDSYFRFPQEDTSVIAALQELITNDTKHPSTGEQH
jgi:hypothetical protein